MNGDRGQDTSKKPTADIYYAMYMHLQQFYLRTRRHRLSCKTQERKTRLVSLYYYQSRDDRRGSERPGWLPGHPRGDLMGPLVGDPLYLSRRQRGSCCNGGLVGPGPSSAPDFPRPSPDSPTSCTPTANRLSDAPSSLSSPDSDSRLPTLDSRHTILW